MGIAHYNTSMNALLLSALCLTAFGASIRSSQAQVDLLQPEELSVQLFGQAFDTLTQSLETQFITMLFPDNFADVQAQLDTCEDNFWNGQVTDLQAINADLWNLLNACTADDPTAPVTQLIQDTLTLMASVTAQCDTLTVDLPGAINNLIAASIVQGIQFTAPWVGPLTEWTAASATPLESLPQYLAPLSNVATSLASTLGVPQESIDQANTDLNSEITTGNTLLNDLANTGTVTQDDVVAALNAELALANDGMTQFGQIVSSSAQYVTQAVSATCSFAGPVLAMLSPAPADEEAPAS